MILQGKKGKYMLLAGHLREPKRVRKTILTAATLPLNERVAF